MPPRRRGYDEMENLLCGLSLALPVVSASSVSLYAQSTFYQSKTITVIVRSDAGGPVDMRVKRPSHLFCASIFRAIQSLLPNTCRAAAGARQPTTSTDRSPRRSNHWKHDYYARRGCGPGRVGGAVQHRQVYLPGSA